MTESGTQGPNGRAKFSNFDFDHFFLRIEPFWVILSKKKFKKIVEKWLSLEAIVREKVKIFEKCPQISILAIYFRELNDSKHFRKFFFWIIQNFQKPNLCLKKNGFQIFLDLKFSGTVPNIIFYHFWKFKKSLDKKITKFFFKY